MIARNLPYDSIRRPGRPFLQYVKLVKMSHFVEMVIQGIFIWLFEKCHLQANTFVSYGSALVKFLSVGFGLSVGSDQFAELLKSFFNV